MRWLAASLAVVSLVAHGHGEKSPPASPLTKTPYMAVIREAPNFGLQAFNGETIKLSELRGRPVLVAFIYTTCTGACPLLSARMSRLQQMLEKARIPAALVSVTVDPQRDDAKTLAAYAKRFGAGPGWHFVREEPARLAPVLAAYDEWTRREGSGELDHPARLHLIDAAGRVREIYSLAFFDEEQAFLDIKALHKQALSR
ncbi:MAG TPA: SCO family protein [Burkholderiales bacterium]|nr:SCO family protein [Burkholderiales bacterium]